MFPLLTLAYLLATGSETTEPAPAAPSASFVRPRLAVGVVGAGGYDWKHLRAGGGPGLQVEGGITLGDRVGLVARGSFASIGLFSLIKHGAAVAFDVTPRWTLGLGVSALILGDVFGLANDMGGPSVGLALSVRAEYRIPFAPARDGTSHGILLFLEGGPGLTLKGGGGFCQPGGCPVGPPVSVDGAFGVAYAWR